MSKCFRWKFCRLFAKTKKTRPAAKFWNKAALDGKCISSRVQMSRFVVCPLFANQMMSTFRHMSSYCLLICPAKRPPHVRQFALTKQMKLSSGFRSHYWILCSTLQTTVYQHLSCRGELMCSTQVLVLLWSVAGEGIKQSQWAVSGHLRSRLATKSRKWKCTELWLTPNVSNIYLGKLNTINFKSPVSTTLNFKAPTGWEIYRYINENLMFCWADFKLYRCPYHGS